MFEQYQHKIKTVEEIKKIIGDRPRTKRIVMCHGTFDIVHPGHMRHLLYAKSKGDLLIASLTADVHIAKGEGRPYVPQDLRAANLAAFEAVDLVLVDFEAEPLKNIAYLQPDFFVKGFEYSSEGVHPKTRKEMEVVSEYGGEFVFSPGDIVYSSTAILRYHKPNLTLEKLATLMNAEGVTFDTLFNLIDSSQGRRIHVVGDIIVDRYTYGSLLGKTTKTPTFSIKRERSETYVGAAGIVAKHMTGLGAKVTLSTVLGNDELAEYVVEDLTSAGITLNVVRDPSRPTTLKERFWASGYKLLQVDTVDNSPVSGKIIGHLAQHIEDNTSETVVFSDFRHGMFHGDSIKWLCSAIPEGAFKLADSQVSSRWGNILDFKKFDVIVPNEEEARFALGDQDSGVRYLAECLLKQAEAKYVALKLGDRGMMCYTRPSASPRSFFSIDSFVEKFVDGVGAGDALLSALALYMPQSNNFVSSIILGNIAAALACEQSGNIPITSSKVRERLKSIQQACSNVGAQEGASL